MAYPLECTLEVDCDTYPSISYEHSQLPSLGKDTLLLLHNKARSVILGSPRLYILNPSTINKLTTLQCLYFDNSNVVDKKLTILPCSIVRQKKKKKKGIDEDDSDPQFGEQKRFCG